MPSPSTSQEPTVLIERTFDFPREVVFDAWTDPALLARWFAPRGCTVRFVRIDVREGGGFHACLQNPEFGDCWTVADFLEVARPERIAFRWRTADALGNAVSARSQGHDPDWPDETQVTVTFSERNGRTQLRLEQNVSAALAKRTGAHPSWVQMLEQLNATLAERRSTELARG
jgi:uncharacterized protein YndB with AHSA1/START domain